MLLGKEMPTDLSFLICKKKKKKAIINMKQSKAGNERVARTESEKASQRR